MVLNKSYKNVVITLKISRMAPEMTVKITKNPQILMASGYQIDSCLFYMFFCLASIICMKQNDKWCSTKIRTSINFIILLYKLKEWKAFTKAISINIITIERISKKSRGDLKVINEGMTMMRKYLRKLNNYEG